MDNKVWKIGIIFAAVFVIAVLGYFLYVSLNKPSQNLNPPSNNNQNRTLGQNEENKLKEFVKNFLSLYNTYSYADFSNLTALGDYETASMQQQTVEKISQLQEKTPAGFSQEAQALEPSFSYNMENETALTASMEFVVIEEQKNNRGIINPRGPGSTSKKNFTATLKLIKQGKNWLVNNLEQN